MVRSPSSRAPWTAASQARVRMSVCWSWGSPEVLRDSASSFRWESGSSVAMAASRASRVSRSVEARSSRAVAFWSAVVASRASLSRNSRSLASSGWDTIPSAMAWETPCFQPASRAWLIVSSSP